MAKIPLTEGKVRKGGVNTPNVGGTRPPAPGGSKPPSERITAVVVASPWQIAVHEICRHAASHARDKYFSKHEQRRIWAEVAAYAQTMADKLK